MELEHFKIMYYFVSLNNFSKQLGTMGCKTGETVANLISINTSCIFACCMLEVDIDYCRIEM